MSFVEELKRRNVFRVGIAYVVVAWLVLQVADVVFDAIGSPDWVMKTLLVILAIGLVFAIIFAWAVKAALIEPFAIACLLQAYFKVTDGQTPNPEWVERLEGASKKFKEMGQKAANWATGGRAGKSAEAPA